MAVARRVVLGEVVEFCAERGIPFEVIVISDWQEAGSNRAYYASTMEWVRTVDDAIGRPST